MRLKSLTIYGLRCLDRSFDLMRCVYVTGPHGRGKTSIKDAISFLALGYVPRVGRTESSTARLMSGRELSVRATFDDGRVAERRLTNLGSRFRGDAFASWVPSKAKMSEHAEAILQLFGADAREVEENLDLGTLLDSSPQTRARRLEEILDASNTPAELQVLAFHALAAARLSERDADVVWAIGSPDELGAWTVAQLSALPPERRAALPAVADNLSDTLLRRGIPEAIGMAAEYRSSAAAGLEQRVQARRELEARIASLGMPTTTVAALRDERQAATDRAAAIRERAEAHRRALEASQQAQDDLEAAKARQASQGATLAHEAALAAREASELASLAPVHIPEAPSSLFQPSGALVAAQRRAEEARIAVEKASRPARPLAPVPPATDSLKRRIASLEADLKAAQLDPWGLVRRHAEELAEIAVDPAVTEHAKALLALAAENGSNVAGIVEELGQASGELAEVEQHFKTAQAAFLKAKEEHVAAHQRYLDLVAERDRALADHDQLDFAERSTFQAAFDEARRNREHAMAASSVRTRRISELRDTQARLEAQVALIASAVTAAEARLSGMQASEPFDADAAADELLAIDSRVLDLDSQMESLQRADARRVELEAITREIAVAEERLICLKAAEWALQRLRERDIGERGAPIITRMRGFLKAAGYDFAPYFHAADGQVDFGWHVGGRTIHVSAMSGAEAVVFTLALAAAVTALRKPAFRTLLVEGAEAGLVTGGLCSALAAVPADLVLVASYVRPGGLEAGGWQVIDL